MSYKLIKDASPERRQRVTFSLRVSGAPPVCAIPIRGFNPNFIFLRLYIARTRSIMLFDDFKIQIQHQFINNSIWYTIFATAEDRDEFVVLLDTDILSMTAFFVKHKDSYVFSRAELKKPFNKIEQVMEQSFIDFRTFKGNIISSVMFNTIAAQKLDYTQFFIDLGLMPNTYVLGPNWEEELKELEGPDKSWVIKAPYSSASLCVGLGELPEDSLCFDEEGVIAQKVNISLQYIEMKSHTVYADTYIMTVDNRYLKTNVGEDRESLFEPLKKILNVNDKKIDELVHNGFMAVNALIDIKNDRRKRQVPILDRLDINNALFFSHLKNRKLKEIDEMDRSESLNELKRLIKLSDMKYASIYMKPLYKQLKSFADGKIKRLKVNVTEPYARVDLALPDNINFKEMYITEIESFACGKGGIAAMRSSMVNEDERFLPSNIDFSYTVPIVHEWIKRKEIRRWIKPLTKDEPGNNKAVVITI